MTFKSFKSEWLPLLTILISSKELHSKWLNTLSYLENCGARKIAACEHPTLVKEEMLKHASEEFRHAYYLKRQIERVISHTIESYHPSNLLGNTHTLHYLKRLDLQACKYLKRCGIEPQKIKEIAYLLVTYAIERRAEELYPLYDQLLRQINSRVTVKSILLEEKEHLAEMKAGIEKLPFGEVHASEICALESTLCQNWLKAISNQIPLT